MGKIDNKKREWRPIVVMTLRKCEITLRNVTPKLV